MTLYEKQIRGALYGSSNAPHDIPRLVELYSAGLLKLDDKVSDTLTEWKADPAKEPVTIRQMLSLSSGIAGGDNSSVPSYADCVKMAKSTARPGVKFQYGPIPFQCLGEVMKRKLAPKGETVADYMKRRILDPIGLNVAFWRGAAAGEPGLPAGAALTPREWVKFGEMVRLGGKLNGKSTEGTRLNNGELVTVREMARTGLALDVVGILVVVGVVLAMF